MVALSLASLALLGSVAAQPNEKKKAGPPPPPPLRKIPGLTAPDSHPRACVDCHKNHPAINLDVRLSTLMKKWMEKVEPRLLARAQYAAGRIKLAGKHPKNKETLAALASVPQKCIACHTKERKKAPPFAKLLHAIHLVGGKDNHFITHYQGDCTHCHKLDPKTAEWKVPSGAEQ